MTKFRTVATLARVLALSVIGPVSSGAQVPLTQREVREIVQESLRTAFAAAKIGARGVSTDSRLAFDTTSLALTSSDGSMRYESGALTGIDAGRALTPSSRDLAFACPEKVVSPALSADCTLRGAHTYVRIGLLDRIDASTAALWVSIIAPGGDPATRSLRFKDFTVRIVVKKSAQGWKEGLPTTRVAG